MFQFCLSKSDADKMSRETEEGQKAILINAAKELPVLNRTHSGSEYLDISIVVLFFDKMSES